MLKHRSPAHAFRFGSLLSSLEELQAANESQADRAAVSVVRLADMPSCAP